MEFADLGISPVKDGRYSTICPKCSTDRRKKSIHCLTVNNEINNRWFNCNHCAYKGNLDIMDRYNKVREMARMPDIPPQTYPTSIHNFLTTKGLKTQTALNLGWYTHIHSDKIYLGIPAYKRGTLVNVKFRPMFDADSRFHQIPKSAGAEPTLIGLDDWDTEILLEEMSYGIISEGETDLATWRQAGFNNSASVPDGAPSPKAQNLSDKFLWLEDVYIKEMLNKFDVVFLAGDNDDAGKRLNEELGLRIGKQKCKIIHYPDGYKDVNEVYNGNKEKGLAALGEQGLMDILKNAKPIPVVGIVRAIDIIDRIEGLSENQDNGLSCGHSTIDKYFRIRRGISVYWTGIPKMGKSTVWRWYMVEASRMNPEVKWALFTPEMTPAEREFRALAQVYMNKIWDSGMPNSMTKEEKAHAIDWVNKHFFIIEVDYANYERGFGINEDTYNTLDSILKYVEYLVRTEGIFGYTIDAWNKIEHQVPKHMPMTNFISRELDKIHRFNKYWNVSSTIIAHPRKMPTLPNGNYQRPTLYDIDGSAAWFNKCDIGVVTHRDEWVKHGSGKDTTLLKDEFAPTQIHIDAMKFKELGRKGQYDLNMDLVTETFNVIGEVDRPSAIHMPEFEITNKPVPQRNYYEVDKDDDLTPF
jgi:twinkle protein